MVFNLECESSIPCLIVSVISFSFFWGKDHGLRKSTKEYWKNDDNRTQFNMKYFSAYRRTLVNITIYFEAVPVSQYLEHNIP